MDAVIPQTRPWMKPPRGSREGVNDRAAKRTAPQHPGTVKWSNPRRRPGRRSSPSASSTDPWSPAVSASLPATSVAISARSGQRDGVHSRGTLPHVAVASTRNAVRATGPEPPGSAPDVGLRLLAESRLRASLGVYAALVAVERTHRVHVGDYVGRGPHGGAESGGARRSVDEGEGDGQTGRPPDPPEAGLPVAALRTGAFRSQDQQERLPAPGLPHKSPHDLAGVVAVDRDATEPQQEPPERATEELLLDEDPWCDAAPPHDEEHHHEVPVGRVRCTDDDAGARHVAHRGPPDEAQHEAGQSTPHGVSSRAVAVVRLHQPTRGAVRQMSTTER